MTLGSLSVTRPGRLSVRGFRGDSPETRQRSHRVDRSPDHVRPGLFGVPGLGSVVDRLSSPGGRTQKGRPFTPAVRRYGQSDTSPVV